VIAAGKRDTLIAFHAVLTTENSHGEPLPASYPLLGREWARVNYGAGTERRTAAIEGTDQAGSFAVLANSLTRTITTQHLIRLVGQDWEIVSWAPIERGEIEFTATRRAK
jgi:hypothetical protein